MPTLHLIVGLPCAGKTTLAKQLEQASPCLRLSPDEWIERLIGVNAATDVLDAARDPIESLLWDVAAKVLQLGGDVILDFGFWSLAERNAARDRAAKLGARCVVHCPKVPEAELLRRLRERNANLPAGCFRIDEERLKAWFKLFEPPTEAELGL